MTNQDIEILCNKKEKYIIDNCKDKEKKETYLSKIQMIRNIIKVKNWALKVSPNELLNILYYLGIPKEKLKTAYYDLISMNNYQDDNEEKLKIIG